MGSSFATILAIAIASNLDNAGVGIAYGVRKIHISWFANLLIAVISGLATYASGWVGRVFTHWVASNIATCTGAAVMIGVGVWVMLEPWRRRSQPDAQARSMVVRILRNPVEADFDRSQTISVTEALVLGVALAVNALVGGFDAGIIHLGVTWVALWVAVFSFVLLGVSAYLGRRYAANALGDKATYVAGALLILIGIHQIW
jgi:putative sporulation protein YtaF